MSRVKKVQTLTTNLCNQYLVIYMDRKKNQFERMGIDRKALVYQTAINSVKKYPLPIICLKQLKSLYGIGQLLSEQLITVIKNHYRSFLKQSTQPPSDLQFEPPPEGSTQEKQEQSLTICKSSSLSQFDVTQSQRAYSQTEEDDNKSNYSFKSATVTKLYRPRPRSQGANILFIISKYGDSQFIERQVIIDKMKEQFNSKLAPKNLILSLANLAKSGYIELSREDFTMVKITRKGEKELEVLQAKSKEKDSQIKVKSMVNSFLAQKEHKHVTELTSQKEKEAVFETEQTDLCLLIDSREVKQKKDQSFFEKKITERWGIRTRTCNLPIGDFMWEYGGKIVDYVVERKKADDLISSIFDGRYKEQKYRLKNSGFENIFYLFEGHLTGSFAKNEREVHSALLNTRIRDGFKVIEVNNITESVKFLHFLTKAIRKKLKTLTKLPILGTLEQVSLQNIRANQLTVSNIFGLSLKTVPGVGRLGVSQVLKHFSTFRELYEKLRELGSRFERVQFLRSLWKGRGVRGNVAELLVDVLFMVKN